MAETHFIERWQGMSWFDSENDLSDPDGKIFCRAYGIIVIENGQFQQVRFKPWPKIISSFEVNHFGEKTHTQSEAIDRCTLYYNQPFFHKNFLALKYVVSNRGTSFRSFRLATKILDEVAQIKRSDALVCEVSNLRISDRLLSRWGWQEHLQNNSGRHFIKRFYGKYPPSLFARESVEEVSHGKNQSIKT